MVGARIKAQKVIQYSMSLFLVNRSRVNGYVKFLRVFFRSMISVSSVAITSAIIRVLRWFCRVRHCGIHGQANTDAEEPILGHTENSRTEEGPRWSWWPRWAFTLARPSFATRPRPRFDIRPQHTVGSRRHVRPQRPVGAWRPFRSRRPVRSRHVVRPWHIVRPRRSSARAVRSRYVIVRPRLRHRRRQQQSPAQSHGARGRFHAVRFADRK